MNTSVSRETKRISQHSNYNIDLSYDDECDSLVQKISDFLLIRRTNCKLDKSMCGYVKSKGITCLSIFLDAHGEIKLDQDQRLTISPYTAIITQAEYWAFNLPIGTQLNSIELLFDTHMLNQQGFDLLNTQPSSFTQKICKGTSVSASNILSTRSMDIINSILKCKNEGINEKLLVQAKALELLSENMIGSCQAHNIIYQTPLHCAKIHKATEIIKQKYYDPLTIKELARTVGINEKKLKDGFREILGTTVHSYMENVRLDNARQLLKSGKRITETAMEVGYSSPSHFAKRFQKLFGQTPKKWQMTECPMASC